MDFFGFECNYSKVDEPGVKKFSYPGPGIQDNFVFVENFLLFPLLGAHAQQ